MAANRCTTCGINWPKRPQYDTCPQCLDDTKVMLSATAISDGEARSIKNHADFERYYEQREEERRLEQDAEFLREHHIR